MSLALLFLGLSGIVIHQNTAHAALVTLKELSALTGKYRLESGEVECPAGFPVDPLLQGENQTVVDITTNGIALFSSTGAWSNWKKALPSHGKSITSSRTRKEVAAKFPCPSGCVITT